MTRTVDSFGSSLRWWRTARRYSQLQLANDAEVSSRHLSFLETGRSRPSREMVIHLATVLDLSLRDRNALLASAGFAPAYPQSRLDGPEMDDIRQVLSAILAAHSPSPAVIVDRRGDVVDANDAALEMVAATVAADSAALQPTVNVHRLTMHPDGIRQRMANWEPLAATVMARLERELAHRPADDELRALVEEMANYDGVAALGLDAPLPTGDDLLLPLELETDSGQRLKLVTTIATIGTPHDVTLEELRLETFFPADDQTRACLQVGLR